MSLVHRVLLYILHQELHMCYDPITRKPFLQLAGVAKPLATGADVSHASSCCVQWRRLVIPPDLNALSFFELFFLYLSMIPFYPLASVSHLAVLYPPPDLLSASFRFLRSQAPESFELQSAQPLPCWYLGILKSNWLHTLGILRSWSFFFWNKEILVMSLFVSLSM